MYKYEASPVNDTARIPSLQSMITTTNFQHRKATSLSILSTISPEKAVLLGHLVLSLEFFTFMYCNLSKHYSCYTNHQVSHSSSMFCLQSEFMFFLSMYLRTRSDFYSIKSHDWFCINEMGSVFCVV